MRDGWTQTTLGEVANITIGRTPPRKEPRYWTRDLERPFCTIADMADSRTVDPTREGVTEIAEVEGKAKRFPKGALLMSFKLTIGRIAFAGSDIFPNEAIAWLNPKDGSLDARFLALALEAQDLEAYAGRAVKGNTLTREAKNSIPLSIPPLDEQHRIVDVIASIDRAIRSSSAYARRIEEVRMGILHATLRRPSTSWKTTTIGNTVTFAGGHAFPRKFQGKEVGDYPFIKVSDMNTSANGRDMSTAANWIDEPTRRKLGARVWPVGTVIFPKVGAALLTEKRRILQVPACFDNNIMGLIAGESILSDYLFYFMETVPLGVLAQTGVVPSINQTHVASLALHLPSLPEQRDFVDVFSSMDDLYHRATASQERLFTVRRNVLSELLSGERDIPTSYDRFLEQSS